MKLRKHLKAEIEYLELRVKEYQEELDKKDAQLRELGKAFSEATKEPPAGCKKGNWCQACVHNKQVVSGYAPYAMTIGVCMKGSCESFVQREETVPKNER